MYMKYVIQQYQSVPADTMGVVVEVCGTVVVLDNSDEYNLKKLQDISNFSMSV